MTLQASGNDTFDLTGYGTTTVTGGSALIVQAGRQLVVDGGQVLVKLIFSGTDQQFALAGTDLGLAAALRRQ